MIWADRRGPFVVEFLVAERDYVEQLPQQLRTMIQLSWLMWGEEENHHWIHPHNPVRGRNIRPPPGDCPGLSFPQCYRCGPRCALQV